MKEQVEALYYELFKCLQALVASTTDRVATPAEVQSVPEVARVLIDLINLQSQM